MKKILAAALDDCIHVQGLTNFLEQASSLGFATYLLGAVIGIDELVNALRTERPDLAALSYRLESDRLEPYLKALGKRIKDENLTHITFLFGGTPETCRVARKFDFIKQVLDGQQAREEITKLLKSEQFTAKTYADQLIERTRNNFPYPLIRHHFGPSSLDDTIAGVTQLAEAEILDVISLTLDANAEEFFFTPELMNPKNPGRLGTRYRKPEDLDSIYLASRTGNFPLMRIYCGTRDLIKWAKVQHETIKNCWGAIPLFWYNQMDDRSRRELLPAIQENQEAIRWYGERKIPLEVNDAYHWSLKQAPDPVTVAAAYLGAYNAKQAGIHHYIVTCMFNSGRENTPQMDLAKMLAQLEMIESLHDKNFTSLRQVSTGMKFFSPDLEIARGQLAAFISNALNLKPAILHLTGSREAHLEGNPQEIIRNCKIARGVVEYFLKGQPLINQDYLVIKRKEQLLKDARLIISAVEKISSDSKDPLCDPEVLAQAVKLGILDAPALEGKPGALGQIKTKYLHGACFSVDPYNGEIVPEEKRLEKLAKSALGTKLMGKFITYLGGQTGEA